MKKHLKAFSSIIVLISLAVSGCGMSDLERIKNEIVVNEFKDNRVRSDVDVTGISLSWWGRDIRHEYMQKGVNVFMEKNPDVKVKTSYAEWAGYETRYFAKEKACEETDVMLINGSWLPTISVDGAGYYDLETLSEYLDLSGYTADELALGRSNGVLNALPIALNTQILYFNKSAYDSYGLTVPSTWDELFEAARVMNGRSYPLCLTDTMLWTACMAYTVQTRDKAFLDKNNRLNFTVEDIEYSLEFYKRLADEKVTPVNEKFDITNTENGVYAGYAGWVSDAESYCALPKAKGDDIVLSNPFLISGAKYNGWYVKPATLYAISDNTKSPEAAAKLLNFLVNDTDMAVLQGIEKGFPLSDKAAAAVDSSEMPTQYAAVCLMEDNMANLDKYNPIAERKEIRDAFFESGMKVIYGESDSESEAKILYGRYKEIIAKSR